MAKVLGVVVVLVLGLGLAGYGVQLYDQQATMHNSWKQTEATIVSAEVTKIYDEDSAQAETPLWVPDIVYEYEVNGKTYRSSKVGSAKRISGKYQSEDVVEQHEVGTTATAYYNPEDPSEAYLVQRPSNKPIGILGGGLVFTFAGLLGVADFIRG